MVKIEEFEVEIGDRIRFRVSTRDGRRVATRKVNGWYRAGNRTFPTVRYEGWDYFVVGWALDDEIIDVIKEAEWRNSEQR